MGHLSLHDVWSCRLDEWMIITACAWWICSFACIGAHIHPCVCISVYCLRPPHVFLFQISDWKATAQFCLGSHTWQVSDIVCGDTVPTWAWGLMGCLNKLSAVAAGFARQQILCCSLIPCQDASCSCILPSSPSFTIVFVFSVGRSLWLCVAGLKLRVLPAFECLCLGTCSASLACPCVSTHCCVLWFNVFSCSSFKC